MGNAGMLLETIKEADCNLKQFDQVLPFEIKQVISGNLMNANRGVGDLVRANEIWDSLFNRQSQSVRLDIYADLYIFRLFSLLHSKTYSLIPSFALSAARFYRKHKDSTNQYAVELPIGQLFRKDRD